MKQEAVMSVARHKWSRHRLEIMDLECSFLVQVFFVM